jgi:antitoxin component of MazEF toxin-antitoxin module
MPETFKAKVRNVGTSLGILIPKEVVVKEKIKTGEEIKVTMLKTNAKNIKELLKLFGSAKGASSFRREHKERMDRYR